MNTRLIALTLLLPIPAVADIISKGDAVIGSSLQQARELFKASSTRARQDCDPVGDGRWICASYKNPSIEDFITGTSGRYSGQPVAVLADTLEQARQLYSDTTILTRVDCDPHADQWICASFAEPSVVDVSAPFELNVLDNPAPLTQSDGAPLPATELQSVSTTSDQLTTDSRSTLPVGSLFQPGDLLSLNYDSCPDPDDLHAAVAGKMVLDHYGLANGTDYIVTNGTCGDLRPRSDFITDSYLVFDKLYRFAWNDAFNYEDFGISEVGDQYLEHLNSGNRVWILDGGPMDFTARVIAYIRGIGTSADLKNITVIQHSHGWNQLYTDPANLSFMEEHVRYLKIDDGNHQGNRTPQLNQSNQQAAFPNVDTQLVARFASDPRYGDAWQLAFEQLSTRHRLDGSDTVELLWALGLGSNEVADWYEFADQFIPLTSGVSDDSEPVARAGLTTTEKKVQAVTAAPTVPAQTEPSAPETLVASEQKNQAPPVAITTQTDPTTPDALTTSEQNNQTRPASVMDSDQTDQSTQAAGPALIDETTLTSTGLSASDSIRIEAESAVLGTGWVRETKRSGFSGKGYIRWTEGNFYSLRGKGITQYIVVPKITGVHTLRIRARAINPPKSDLNNDVWVRMNGELAAGSIELNSWVKMFTTGQDAWQLGGTVDKAHKMQLFQQYLVAGEPYTLEISGRSTGYAIDYFEVSPADD